MILRHFHKQGSAPEILTAFMETPKIISHPSRCSKSHWTNSRQIAIWAVGLFILIVQADMRADNWKAEGDRITTAWADQLDPSAPLPEYPRPQMVRPLWKNLNGLWDYAICSQLESRPEQFDGKILVPFAVESFLSGVQRKLSADQALWYQTAFQIPEDQLWTGKRILLHFGAVDWAAEVWLNGAKVGDHQGGYDAFHFDITEFIRPGRDQTLLVKVCDPTDQAGQPRGKQVSKPNTIWYTAVSGIWQTVWIEPVPPESISSLKIVPNIDAQEVSITVTGGDELAKISVLNEGKEIGNASGKIGTPIRLPLKNPIPWSPDSPHLYDLKIVSGSDEILSYFGMRKISVQKDSEGVPRLALNNKILFQYGLLDQGWWPDGLYTAPTDEALRWDIEATKKLGFNMIRKHVKIEPARWYYWADRLGILVWQDMPSAMNLSNEKVDGSSYFVNSHKPEAPFTPEEARTFKTELTAMLDQLHNVASIVVWVPFNEGWGQHDSSEILQWLKERDPSRLVDGPSGWVDKGVGDLKDMHRYPDPTMFPPMPARVSVLGEFGGLGLPTTGHMWTESKRNWGHRIFDSKEALQKKYSDSVKQVRRLIPRGLAAAVYTQTTDVESEVNGLYTYDRKVLKLPAEWLAAEHALLYGPLKSPRETVVLPSGKRSQETSWSYTFEKPADGWTESSFDDSGWKKGIGPFGAGRTPNCKARTEWNTPDIWLRRTFDLAHLNFHSLYLEVYHDESAEVYFNGVEVAKVSGYTVDYILFELSRKAIAQLKQGTNVLTIHCRQTVGGQCIDAGLVDFEEVK